MEKNRRLVCQSIHILLVIVVCSLCFSCSRSRTFVLDGEVKDGGQGMVYLYRYGNKNFKLVDSVAYVQGKFQYKGEVDQPLLYGISVRRDDDAPQSFFVGEDTLRLSFWKTGKEVLTQDSPLNDEYLSMRDRTQGASEQAILRYVHDYGTSPVTAYFVLHDWSWRLNLPTLKLIEKSLRPSLSDCIYLQNLQELIKYMEQVQPGKTPPPIKGIPMEQKDYTVLVFFATWCPDCRIEMPEVERVARERKQTRFIGFSLDTQEAPLNDFKKNYQSVFQIVLSDYKGWDSPVVQRYAVRWIPTFFLISPEGKVLKSAQEIKDLF